jgi:hypothetical protein
MDLHVVTIKTGGFAREDADGVRALGAYTDLRIAGQVKTIWGSSANVSTVRVNVIPKGVLDMAKAMDVQFSKFPSNEALQRARAAHEKATPGKWSWNCAGEILATIDGKEVVIGSFNGCEADAAAACKLHNRALELFELAGIEL